MFREWFNNAWKSFHKRLIPKRWKSPFLKQFDQIISKSFFHWMFNSIETFVADVRAPQMKTFANDSRRIKRIRRSSSLPHFWNIRYHFTISFANDSSGIESWYTCLETIIVLWIVHEWNDSPLPDSIVREWLLFAESFKCTHRPLISNEILSESLISDWIFPKRLISNQIFCKWLVWFERFKKDLLLIEHFISDSPKFDGIIRERFILIWIFCEWLVSIQIVRERLTSIQIVRKRFISNWTFRESFAHIDIFDGIVRESINFESDTLWMTHLDSNRSWTTYLQLNIS